MRIRIRVERTGAGRENEYANVRLMFGCLTQASSIGKEVVSEKDVPITAPADKPQAIHFDIPLSEILHNPYRQMKGTKEFAEILKQRRQHKIKSVHDELLTINCVSDGRVAIYVQQVEIIAPFYETWPPQSHRAIFIESKNKTARHMTDRGEMYCRKIRQPNLIEF